MVTAQQMQDTSFYWPLALSTLAGLSTSIGGVIAVLQKPEQHTMSGLLGVAIGVMATVSIVELIVRNALEHDAFLVCAAALGGGLAYYILEPFFPKVDEQDLLKKDDGTVLLAHSSGAEGVVSSSSNSSGDGEGGSSVAQRKRGAGGSRSRGSSGGAGATTGGEAGDTRGDTATSNGPRPQGSALATSAALHGTGPRSEAGATTQGQSHHASGGLVPGSASGNGGALACELPPHTYLGVHTHSHGPSAAAFASAQKRAGLLRLGMLMAITMTLHNLPEGFAVAFSAFTSFGPIMAVAIALHNIPEGVIIAAPIYAATGSRAYALGVATASGLSEPLGALAALVVLKPFITPERLQYLLACVGGLMLAVCVIELWPEARACKNDRALAIGITLGSVVMGWTLWVGG